MRNLSAFSQARKQTLLHGLLACIFLLTLFLVAGTPAFAVDAPPAGQGQQNAPGMMGGMTENPDKEGKPDKDCKGPPVVCVGVDVSQLPFPGCTSGQRCSLDTTGKPCGMLLQKTTCQTVNDGTGVCKCSCLQ
jgi:hypothetical protein